MLYMAKYLPNEIKIHICEYVSCIWYPSVAVFLFPELKQKEKNIPTYLLNKDQLELRENKRKKRYMGKFCSYLINKWSNKHNEHTIYVNSLHEHEIKYYCNQIKNNNPIQNIVYVRPIKYVSCIKHIHDITDCYFYYDSLSQKSENVHTYLKEKYFSFEIFPILIWGTTSFSDKKILNDLLCNVNMNICIPIWLFFNKNLTNNILYSMHSL